MTRAEILDCVVGGCIMLGFLFLLVVAYFCIVGVL